MDTILDPFDVAIIGAGPGGYSTALRASQLGLRVLLVEKDETVGGTCLNRGCIPSKALLDASERIHTIATADAFGIHASLESIDFQQIHERKADAVHAMVSGLSSLLEARKVTLAHAYATLIETPDSSVDEQPMRYLQLSGTTETFSCTIAGETSEFASGSFVAARHIVLAPGSRPATIEHTDKNAHVIDSTGALAMVEAPESITIIGSGAIALEFATYFSQVGSKVTLLIRRDTVLSRWDASLARMLTREMKKNISIIKHTSVLRVESYNTLSRVVYQQSSSRSKGDVTGAEQHVDSNVVLVAIGRKPNTSWLSDTSLEIDSDGYVVTDAWGRTNSRNVWAVGDCVRGAGLAHRAFEQGIVVAESIAGGEPTPVSEHTVANVVFSHPQAASVGYSLQQAKEDDTIVNPRQIRMPVGANSRMYIAQESGNCTLVVGAYRNNPDVTVLLGCSLLAPLASELIGQAQHLIAHRVPLSEASRIISAHPTFSEILGEALLKADNRPLHTW